MVSHTVGKEARGAWLEYGLEVARKFRFAPDTMIVRAPLDDVLQTSDEAVVREFISYVRDQTAMLKHGDRSTDDS